MNEYFTPEGPEDRAKKIRLHRGGNQDHSVHRQACYPLDSGRTEVSMIYSSFCYICDPIHANYPKKPIMDGSKSKWCINQRWSMYEWRIEDIFKWTLWQNFCDITINCQLLNLAFKISCKTRVLITTDWLSE